MADHEVKANNLAIYETSFNSEDHGIEKIASNVEVHDPSSNVRTNSSDER
jgi:hypothetical protein